MFQWLKGSNHTHKKTPWARVAAYGVDPCSMSLASLCSLMHSSLHAKILGASSFFPCPSQTIHSISLNIIIFFFSKSLSSRLQTRCNLHHFISVMHMSVFQTPVYLESCHWLKVVSLRFFPRRTPHFVSAFLHLPTKPVSFLCGRGWNLHVLACTRVVLSILGYFSLSPSSSEKSIHMLCIHMGFFPPFFVH